MNLLRIALGTSNPDVRITIQHISINPTVSATISYQIVSNTEGIKQQELTIDGQQYAAWGNDDTIIYHIICARHNLQYVPYVEPEFYEEAFVYKNEQGEIVTQTIRKPNPSYIYPPVPTPTTTEPTTTETTTTEPTTTEPTTTEPTTTEPTTTEPTTTEPTTN